MKQLQVTVPAKFRDTVNEILENYSSDVSSTEAEKKDEKVAEFSVTVESDQIDDLTEELKGVKDIESGDLSIRVLKQESLIRKGQKTKGSESYLSQEELYSKAQSASNFSGVQWGLIGLSSVIAAFGLASDNVIAVIGAMMLAPILSPFISAALSLVVGDTRLMVESVKYGTMSILAVVAVSFVAVIPFPVSMNGTLELVSSPSIVSILLSLFVGSAAALTFASDLRDEVAGVAVAIALVPPLASIGIGLKLQSISMVLSSSAVASINVLAVIVAGFASFQVLGLKPSTYYKKKQAEKFRYIVPAAFIVFGLLSAPIAVSSYQGYQDYTLEEDIRETANSHFGGDLLRADINGNEATLYVVGNYSSQEFNSMLPEKADITLVRLQKFN